MTNKRRTKECATCKEMFSEHPGDSERQWRSRTYCSHLCVVRRADRARDVYARLEEKQVKRPGCWGWNGPRDGGGYGTLSSRRGSGNAPEKAHRLSYEKHVGPIPKGMFVCHKCDNPICSNPDHLFLGTAKDNAQDCSRKGRFSPVSLMNLQHDKVLTKEQVEEIQRTKFVALNGRGQGRRVKDVAKEYGVCKDLITAIKHRRYEGK